MTAVRRVVDDLCWNAIDLGPIMRAFFAVDIPDDLSDPLADAQAAFGGADGLRFVDPDRAHVTLKFLGEIGEADPADRSGEDEDGPPLDDVIAAGERAVGDAGVGPFECAIEGYGVFPSLDYVSVVWAGVGAGSAALTALHESLEAETTAIGVDPEAHAFTPHVTLARMDDARGKELVRRVVRETDPDLGAFRVEEIRLKQSTLTGDGPEYETLRTVEL